ncbi:hypothetical protein ABWK22_01905 [Gottfriedia acidiceleris]|uniref:hypothetical protein n=1 Tax=Gottfriedia acidiceleris TaxID=371036 RepID=UPI00339520B8
MLSLLENETNYRLHKKYVDGLLKSKDEIIQIANDSGKTKIYRVLSFGGGTQSSHLLEEHFKGNIDYDYIVFSDTGAEPQFIHDQVEWWKERQKKVGNTTPFIITTHNSMERGLEEMLMRYIFTDYQRFQLPLYFSKRIENGELKPAGMMRRQCTGDFKIVPVQQAVRKRIKQELGLREKQLMPKDVGIVMDIGFSFDEINRVGGYVSHQSNYIYLAYPLIEEGLSTQDSIQFLLDNNFPSKRSRCYFCPFNCDGKRNGMDWDEIIQDEPLSFLKACFFDEKLREVQASGRKLMQSIPFFHYSRRPLKEVFTTEYETLMNLFEPELNEWISEWNQFLISKYNAVA